MIRAAVLTISDSSFAGQRADASGPAVKSRLEQLGWEVAITETLPDEQDQISARLRTLAAFGEIQVVFTTGGTGIAARDVTPEATREVLDREIPGLAERMRAAGCRKTPMAALSRAVAGIAGKSLIVNLPGSPRAAVESLDAIVELVPHMLELLAGKTSHG
jgi:molybdenum cofactor synthesis domain-containing protein